MPGIRPQPPWPPSSPPSHLRQTQRSLPPPPPPPMPQFVPRELVGNVAQAAARSALDGLKSAAAELLLRRLLRREQRVSPLSDDVETCVQEFQGLVGTARDAGSAGLEVSEWEDMCDVFSHRWKRLCHPTCPSRLAEFLETHLVVHWHGGRPIRRGPVAALARRSRQQAVSPAQPHVCLECGVCCNSHTQVLTHLRGRRHLETVARLAQEAAASGQLYIPQAPQPLRRADPGPAVLEGADEQDERPMRSNAELSGLLTELSQIDYQGQDPYSCYPAV